MPGLDGIAAAREIRDRYPQLKVIGLSEYAYGYNTDAMEKAGAVGVYQKSMALEQLYPAIKKFAPAHPTHKLRQAPQPSQPSCFSGSVAGPWRRDGYPSLLGPAPLDFAHEVITSETSDHKKGNDLSRFVLLVGHHSI